LDGFKPSGLLQALGRVRQWGVFPIAGAPRRRLLSGHESPEIWVGNHTHYSRFDLPTAETLQVVPSFLPALGLVLKRVAVGPVWRWSRFADAHPEGVKMIYADKLVGAARVADLTARQWACQRETAELPRLHGKGRPYHWPIAPTLERKSSNSFP